MSFSPFCDSSHVTLLPFLPSHLPPSSSSSAALTSSPVLSASAQTFLPSRRSARMTQAFGELIDWIIFLTGSARRARQAPTGERVSKATGRHMYTITCARKTHAQSRVIRVTLSITARREHRVLTEGRHLTHLTEKDLVTVGSVRVHRVYVIPASDGRRGREREMRR